jgi:hypothetical protein
MAGNPMVQGLLGRFLGRLRFPQLFVLMALLFAFDLLVPDFLPLVDELLLAAGTLLLSQLRRKDAPPPEPEIKNVTPRGTGQ